MADLTNADSNPRLSVDTHPHCCHGRPRSRSLADSFGYGFVRFGSGSEDVQSVRF
ncbi:hypothetical protein Syun_029205 [Stephania yunnanensis]|uniref:Uncharacterized protein n=1 Tax=Stephania yunnanensis TaxID=152371 RepID=A0AAP0E575_9MAGN